MKREKESTTTLFKSSSNAADELTTDNLASPPEFSPSVNDLPLNSIGENTPTQGKSHPFQMKTEEEEESVQAKTDPFQMKTKEEEEEPVQAKSNPFQMKTEEEEEPVQAKTDPFQMKIEKEELQMKKTINNENETSSGASTKTKIPENVQMKMESAFNADFSDVNIHSNSADARTMGAQAYAKGNDVHFAPGKYNPESQSGQELLGHELTHVVQQRQGRVSPTTQMKGVSVNDDKGLENEADQMGKMAAQGKMNKIQPVTNVNVSKQTIQGNFLGDAAAWVADRVGDATNTRPNEAVLDAKEDAAALAEEKRTFRSQAYGPMTYTRPNIIGSGFEASYFPNANLLNAEVRAKVRYADGIVDNGATVSSPNEFMNRGRIITILSMFPALKAQVLPFFQWGSEEKQINIIRFKENIRSTMNVWENTGMSFQVNQPGWEDVTAVPNIDIQVAEGSVIHKTENYGPFGMLTRTDEQGSDHLQLEIVKQLNVADAATVNTLIANYINNLPIPGILKNQLIPPSGDATGVRSYLGNDSNSTADSGHNNFMSLESNRSDDPADKNFFHSSQFEHDTSDLTPDEEASLNTFLADPQVLLRNPSGRMNIDLEGFASASGSTEYNTELVNRRLTTVSNIINSRIDSSNLNIRRHVDPASERNNSDLDAETDKATNPDTYSEEAYRAVDIKIEHSGRGGQNVLAHEFGHIFGLGDEYAETTNGYNRPAGALADHDQLAKDAGVAGGAVVGNDQRMMSTGNNVGAAHYSTFADALRQMTGKPWKIIP